jgi:hypothetical protein
MQNLHKTWNTWKIINRNNFGNYSSSDEQIRDEDKNESLPSSTVTLTKDASSTFELYLKETYNFVYNNLKLQCLQLKV